MNFEKYNENLSYSYSFGAFGTIELLKQKSSFCLAVIIDPSFIKNEAYKKIEELCQKSKIEIIVNHQLIEKIRDKDNIFVIGVFKKYHSTLDNDRHIIIYDIDDYGLIGTIIRSMNGFNYHNLALINCNVDVFNKHLIRASMGAFFALNIQSFDSIETYHQTYQNKQIINISNIGKKAEKYSNDCDITYAFSNKAIDNSLVSNVLFDKDLSLDNIVNIVLFSLYHR